MLPRGAEKSGSTSYYKSCPLLSQVARTRAAKRYTSGTRGSLSLGVTESIVSGRRPSLIAKRGDRGLWEAAFFLSK